MGVLCCIIWGVGLANWWKHSSSHIVVSGIGSQNLHHIRGRSLMLLRPLLRFSPGSQRSTIQFNDDQVKGRKAAMQKCVCKFFKIWNSYMHWEVTALTLYNMYFSERRNWFIYLNDKIQWQYFHWPWKIVRLHWGARKVANVCLCPRRISTW